MPSPSHLPFCHLLLCLPNLGLEVEQKQQRQVLTSEYVYNPTLWLSNTTGPDSSVQSKQKNTGETIAAFCLYIPELFCKDKPPPKQQDHQKKQLDVIAECK